VGKAGQLLDKMLAAIGLSRQTNCFIANVVKCRPPGNRDPWPEETQACGNFLTRQVQLLRPQLILCVGKVSAQALLKNQDTIGSMRGKFFDYQIGGVAIPLIATYHPSALLHNEEYKRPAWEDLKMLRTRLDNAI
jgi:DNA polymerase